MPKKPNKTSGMHITLFLNLGPDNKKIGKNLDQYSGMTHLHNKRNK